SASDENRRTCRTRSSTPAAARLRWNTSKSSSAASSKPWISWRPRSLPAWGSSATTSACGAARASTIVDRPRKLPISTIRPPDGTAAAACHSRVAWASVSHPSTSAIASRTSGSARGAAPDRSGTSVAGCGSEVWSLMGPRCGRSAGSSISSVSIPTTCDPPPLPNPPHSSTAKLGDIAAAAGIERVHVLAWRDLEDPEAGGSELHIHEVARRWAAAGLRVTMRTSHAPGRAEDTVRDGYRVIRRAGRYLIFPRAALSELAGRHGPADALVEIWNGVPFLSPLWHRGPRL